MHTPLYDHSFKTIGYMTEQSRHFIPPALEAVKKLRARITEEYDAETADNVIGRSIEHALTRCQEHFEDARHLSDEDYHIFYEYAANAAIGIDTLISNELPEL